MSYLDRQRKGIEMWAVLHVPSGAWHHGDTELKLYHAEYTARYDCPSDAWVPVKVIVKEAKP
jgi:hypothetical protein